MADTYHAIKLYKTTANSTTSSKRVGINVTDSTVTTGYALYVNGAINITDSLKTNSLNTGDLVVTGSASFTNGVNGITAANVPNLDASKITSGTLGADRIPGLAASKITSGTLGVDRIPSLSTDKLTSGTLGVARGGTGRGTLTSNAILTGNGTSAINMVATASGAAYATAANGALTFGTLPVAQGGTGRTALTGSNSLRSDLGFGTGTGVLAAANGGTGQSSLQATRNAMGLGNTTGALPIANGGTGVTTISAFFTNVATEYKDVKTIALTSSAAWQYRYATVTSNGVLLISVTGQKTDAGVGADLVVDISKLVGESYESYGLEWSTTVASDSSRLSAHNVVAFIKVSAGDKIRIGSFINRMTVQLTTDILAFGTTLSLDTNFA